MTINNMGEENRSMYMNEVTFVEEVIRQYRAIK